MALRPYQQNAREAAVDFMRQYIEPCLIEAVTAAGKSHIIAAIAHDIHTMSRGKHVLCLAPNAELVMQNREKYIATGNPASVFSASAGRKCLRHPVVFGTPGTVKNRISRFGEEFALLAIDECHGITPTIKMIAERMRAKNPNLRILGTTATPYRMGSGYIYALDENDNPMGEDSCRDPYFAKKVYTIAGHELISAHYLTPPRIAEINAESYHTLDMQLNSRGQFDKNDVDQAYHGHGRKTAAIIADIVRKSKDKRGIMIFAATVQHAQECMASLPPELSAIATSETPKKERERIVKRFKEQRIKYLVNVALWTTGFDAPHVDGIGILRATESVGLLQQIIGRGLRLYKGKLYCDIWDYAENIERHCPDGDVFNPEIKISFRGEDKGTLIAECPSCGAENKFSKRENKDGFEVNQFGNFVDLDGNEIKTDFGPMPAHYGRRCQAMHKGPGGTLIQCSYRWTYKECPHCGHENDIAAKYCQSCKGEIVDPNEKLKIEFRQLKKDPTRMQIDKVVSMSWQPTMTKAGNEAIRVDFVTEYRSFSIWISDKFKHARNLFNEATNNGTETPKTVTYKKDVDSGFYRVYAYNQDPDIDESNPEVYSA